MKTKSDKPKPVVVTDADILEAANNVLQSRAEHKKRLAYLFGLVRGRYPQFKDYECNFDHETNTIAPTNKVARS